MNKNILMILAALMTLSASQTLVAGKKGQASDVSHKHHAHHNGAKPSSSAHDRRQERALKVERYKALRRAEYERALAAGKYAYLEKSPAWANEALSFDKKMQLTVNANYHYASDCYDSSGSGSNSDVTRLTFGEAPIKLQDILLASRLVAAGSPAVTQIDALATPKVSAANGAYKATDYLSRTAKDSLTLLGKVENYGMHISLARHVIGNNLSVGLDVPVVYKNNRLDIDYDFQPRSTETDSVLHIGPMTSAGGTGPYTIGAGSTAAPTAATTPGTGTGFLNRYGNNPQRYLKDILKAKGITEVGGSAAGLGDIALFMTGHIQSSLFDQLAVGLRLQLPTGKKQAMHKLWAPDLGNGGFTEMSVFGNAFVAYKKYLNPHIALSAGCSLPAHVDRRVPKYFEITNAVGDDVSKHTKELAFADRIKFNAGSQTLKGFDSLVPNFGDTVSRVKITRGAEIKMRLGNMMERFISRRGFFDAFYDFRVKMKDMASGLSSNLYDIGSVRNHTNQLEHRLGFDYSHQFDLETRLRLGARYTVAGVNVPKAFDLVASVNHAF
jgi:hypothetical protein